MAAKKKKDKPKKKKTSRFVAVVPDRVQREIEDLLEAEDADAAQEIVDEWLEKRPNDPILHFYAGCAHGINGNYVKAVVHYRRAQRADRRNETLWRNLFPAYMEIGCPIHALRTLKRYLQTEMAEEDDDLWKFQKLREHLESFRRDMASHTEVDAAQFDEFCYWNEEAQIAQFEADWDASIAAAGRALAVWPGNAAARNNRAVSHFFAGRVDAAIAEEKEVAAQHPDNVHALCNLVRFCEIAGDRASAVAYFEQVKALRPDQWESQSQPIEKLLEAYAFAGSDGDVYAFCQAHIDEVPERGNYMLGAAAANLGHVREAVHAWESAMEYEGYWSDLAEEALEALRSGKPGLARGPRFPYVGAFELFGYGQFDQVVHSLMQKTKGRHEADHIIIRHPGLLAFAQWMLHYGADVRLGLSGCALVDTEAAWEMVRDFALGQAGTDDERFQAVQILVAQGKLPPEASMRLWIRGEWKDVLLKQLEIRDDEGGDDDGAVYGDEITDMLTRAGEAIEAGKLDQAERLYLDILEQEPACLQAYNNLGLVAGLRKDATAARSHLEKALEIDPDYVVGRCNLASIYADSHESDRAKEVLKPLVDQTQFTALEIKCFYLAWAKIHLAEGDEDAARKGLEILKSLYPDDPAVQTLEKDLNLVRPIRGLRRWLSSKKKT